MKRLIAAAALAVWIPVISGCQAHPTVAAAPHIVQQQNVEQQSLEPAPRKDSTATPATEPEPAALPVATKVFSISPTKEKRVAITFDDGPDKTYTPQILDILKSHQVKATFFLIGEKANEHPDVVKRIYAEGHDLGNHTWNHRQLSKMPAADIEAEIARTDDLLKKTSGTAPKLFRSPYGETSEDIMRTAAQTGHSVIGWSVDTRDWEGHSAEAILATVKKELKPGAVILMHSAGGKGGNRANTVKALPQVIAYLKQQGYRIETVSELMDAVKQ